MSHDSLDSGLVVLLLDSSFDPRNLINLPVRFKLIVTLRLLTARPVLDWQSVHTAQRRRGNGTDDEKVRAELRSARIT